jgi:hypothetical protein
MMMKKEKDKEPNQRPPVDESSSNEGRSSSWVQKYLDLADLLMRRRKEKRDTPTKAA